MPPVHYPPEPQSPTTSRRSISSTSSIKFSKELLRMVLLPSLPHNIHTLQKTGSTRLSTMTQRTWPWATLSIQVIDVQQVIIKALLPLGMACDNRYFAGAWNNLFQNGRPCGSIIRVEFLKKYTHSESLLKEMGLSGFHGLYGNVTRFSHPET